MLLVDDRAGSKELETPLRKLGLPVELTRLEFGDIAFIGRGEKGADVSVGIEFKQLRELVQALRTERLQGFQLLGMRDTYDYSYLFFEGQWLYDKQGLLQRRKQPSNRLVPLEGQMTISELLKRVFVLHLRGGLNPWPTTSREDTLSSIRDLYRTWTDKDLDQHKSHLGIYVAPGLVPVSDIRRSFKTFPGLGMAAAQAADQYFGSNLTQACAASIEEWSNITTIDEKGKPRRLGANVATVIWNHLHGGTA